MIQNDTTTTKSAASRLRIGAVSYLNTKPLVFGLAEAVSGFADLSFAVPSRLAIELTSNALDVGLIPAIEYFRHPERKIISDACIACHGPVWSVQVLFRKPPREVETLAVDEGSRTSVALTQILLAERFNVRPTLVPFSLHERIENAQADAVLVIGDRAMHLESCANDFVERWDLGQAWLEHTGLPFVFAMWVANKDVPTVSLETVLAAQRDLGLANVELIAERYGASYELAPRQAVAYLTKFLRFKLGPD